MVVSGKIMDTQAYFEYANMANIALNCFLILTRLGVSVVRVMSVLLVSVCNLHHPDKIKSSKYCDDANLANAVNNSNVANV